MKTTKLSKTQQKAWDRIRHASPAGFRTWAGTCQYRQDGTVWAGKNKKETILALEKAGLIRVVNLASGLMSDVVEITSDVGSRKIRVAREYKHPSSIHPQVDVQFTTNENYTMYIREGNVTAQKIADLYRSVGFEVEMVESI